MLRDFVVLDEAHHGAAPSYRDTLALQPRVLLGLTATPERMDGSSILPDFDGRFAAEIRLPEALEEKYLCPFHYFGITDPIDLAEEQFWAHGRYDENELTKVYTGDDLRARLRLDVILTNLRKYQPEVAKTRAVGFCASVRHAEFMAAKFNEAGLPSAEIVGHTPAPLRAQRLADFRAGRLKFLFTVNVLSEGIDVPEINLVLFLRPTESLNVFLQQLGRGLRHAPEKECLTVLDFIGLAHRRYRLDLKFGALLSRKRRRIDEEVKADFPSLPPGCNIQLERVAREHILHNIQATLHRLDHFIPEALRTFQAETGLELNFANFVRATQLDPLLILKHRTWSEWKHCAGVGEAVVDPDLEECRKALRRVTLRSDPGVLRQLEAWTAERVGEPAPAYGSEAQEAGLHYLLWAKQGEAVGATSYAEARAKWRRNARSVADLREIVAWRRDQRPFPTPAIERPAGRGLHLHAAYGSVEIRAAFGLARLNQAGARRDGVYHLPEIRTYLHLFTFWKEDKDFSPTTRYKDYLISRSRLHWETQARITQASRTGQNYLEFQERGYTILFFARLQRQILQETAPFLFLGPAERLVSVEGNRPVSMVWDLAHPVPAELFEEARVA